MKTFKTKHIIICMMGWALTWVGHPVSAQEYSAHPQLNAPEVVTDSLTTPTAPAHKADTLQNPEGLTQTFADSIEKKETLQLSPVLANDRLREDSTTDSLTVLQNQKTITEMEAPVDTISLYAANDSINLAAKDTRLPKKAFIPDPQRALWLSLVLPGAGQIYNRKYWKLPIIYGGFLGCTYALLWNQQMYMDYSQAYLDIMDDDPNTDSYLDMLPPRYDITGQEERFKKIFKNKKDHFRRFRDLSAFCFVGVYLLSVIDAYVDAQLSEFDITPDLSLRLEPAVIPNNGLNSGKNAYGVGCSINF